MTHPVTGDPTDPRLDWIISVDDHVVEPPDVWQGRMPRKLQDRAPYLVNDDIGEAWIWDGRRYPTSGLSAAAGKSRDEFSPLPLKYSEMRAGCYDAVARIEDMNRDRVLASLVFPTFPRFAGPMFSEIADHELGLACIRAYNDWIIDEWCGSAPGRFIPMVIVPLWDGQLAAAEMERCAGKGAKAITFPENPAPLGFPSLHDRGRHWDPLFDAAAEAGLPLCTHIGSSSQLPTTAPDAPFIITTAITNLNACTSCADWLFSGLFIRFPKLKLCLSEGGIGWIPYLLERLDYTFDRQRGWASKGDVKMDVSSGSLEVVALEELDYDPFSVLPSVLFRDHIYGCFIDDIHGSQNIREIGVRNVMVETDFPHPDSWWPNSLETVRKRIEHLDTDEQYLVMQGNARRVFNFEPAEPPEVADASGSK